MEATNLKNEYAFEVASWNKPVPVVQVKPELKGSAIAAEVFGRVGAVFLSAWFLNMIIPAVTPWELGYWQCIWLYIGAGLLFKNSRLFHNFSDLKGK